MNMINPAAKTMPNAAQTNPEKGLSQAHEKSNKSSPGLVVNVGGVEQQVTKETARIQAQASIIQHLFGDKSNGEQNASKILFQEAIDQINQALETDLGPDAINAEKLAEQGGMDYWSPENTASRIVLGTTAMFEAFKKANPDLEGEAVLDRFLEVVGGGIEKGFKQATELLTGFDVFDGSIKENADKTYQLVQQGLQDFRAQQLEKLANAAEADAAKTSDMDKVAVN
ncbi:DUF5610 domain-containing protein [Thiomicrospira sp. ALE5]|uniref:DUF5610 domain-containing protein n=1 Tax=Thiomicrospira sp. ALE5 TaxID=748650 RepID=UPI0008E9D18B|nr:DUF5610 domain-containing protein [Thiomicrospira sp. ALE5]SFR49740.1 hypothetical protein SAMN03092900_0227 [Thiomicrospira sp. ALE5]